MPTAETEARRGLAQPDANELTNGRRLQKTLQDAPRHRQEQTRRRADTDCSQTMEKQRRLHRKTGRVAQRETQNMEFTFWSTVSWRNVQCKTYGLYVYTRR